MPTPAQGLTVNSPDTDVADAIQKTIRGLMREGYKQNQAIAVAYRQAREATGRELRKVGRKGRQPKVRRWTAR